MFNTLCVIGVGLIGGSVARAARKHGLCRKVVGFGREQDRANLQTAVDLGVIDCFHHTLSDAVLDAECVVIATPVGSIESVLAMLRPCWDEKTIYTDVGSTKSNILNAARQLFGKSLANFVPGHPIAGAEQSGVTASVADLFVNKRVILTPDIGVTSSEAVRKISEFWQAIGANVETMTAEHHDAVFAATSHLPHIAAFALVDMLGQKDEQSEIFKYAASGFKDFTRIASSDPNMWLDICMANKNEIIPLLHELQNTLSKIQNMLETQDRQRLFDTFTYARKARQRFLDLLDN